MKTITFQDHGQDFLEWDLDDAGVVVACRPFQANMWVGKVVENHADIARGGIALLSNLRYIRYPIVKVSTRKRRAGEISSAVLNSKVVTRGAKAILAAHRARGGHASL